MFLFHVKFKVAGINAPVVVAIHAENEYLATKNALQKVENTFKKDLAFRTIHYLVITEKGSLK